MHNCVSFYECYAMDLPYIARLGKHCPQQAYVYVHNYICNKKGNLYHNKAKFFYTIFR